MENFMPTLAITEVLNRYFAALDERKLDVETLSGIFTTDAKIVRPNGSVTVGPKAIGESHIENFSHFRATQHITSGFIITQVSDTEVRFRGNLIAMHLWAEGQGDPKIDPNENYFLAGGVITGDVVSLEKGWRIAEIANDVVWRRGVGFQQMLKEIK
ncbi:MAG: nuclear transport factor 2 family protein [Candidatus Yonathbacteria bacterium]|nr:nuclear transport factor 2 family protein [Candidatus Yonathbacteria bacterium]